MLDELRKELERQERSVAWLARKCDVDPSMAWRVLRGERNASADFKSKAAEALGVPVENLFGTASAAA